MASLHCAPASFEAYLGRLSMTRFALPIERSMPPISTMSMRAEMPM